MCKLGQLREKLIFFINRGVHKQLHRVIEVRTPSIISLVMNFDQTNQIFCSQAKPRPELMASFCLFVSGV